MSSAQAFGEVAGMVFLENMRMAQKGTKPREDDGMDLDVKVKTRQILKKPNLYRVLLLNDDYTTMDFVIYVLERFFNKNREEATHIMLNVHRSGHGECGIFTYEVAEAKIAQVLACAKQYEYPLQCVMEKK